MESFCRGDVSEPDPLLEHAARTAALALRTAAAVVRAPTGTHSWRKSGAAAAPQAAELVTDAPLIIPDASLDPRFEGVPGIGFFAGVPVRGNSGETYGALTVQDPRPRRFGRAERRLLQNLASLLGNQIELRRLADTDALTGAANRRHLLERAETQARLARRHGLPFSFLIMDIDRFKSINDTHGHPAGDAVLNHVVAHCRSLLRAEDTIGRLGGEEFAILLPATDAKGARAVAERIRASIAATPAPMDRGSISITASFGVVTLRRSGEAISAALLRADRALYAAKNGGRNRVIIAEPDQPRPS